MTIGPEPITSTCRTSPRLGTPTPGTVHQVVEPVEEVAGVVRPGRRLRVVLHPERRPVQAAQTLYHAVVEVDVGHLGPAELGLADPVGRRLHGEPVVVRGDFDPAGGVVADRLVDAAVAVPELVRAEPQRPAEELAAEAD